MLGNLKASKQQGEEGLQARYQNLGDENDDNDELKINLEGTKTRMLLYTCNILDDFKFDEDRCHGASVNKGYTSCSFSQCSSYKPNETSVFVRADYTQWYPQSYDSALFSDAFNTTIVEEAVNGDVEKSYKNIINEPLSIPVCFRHTLRIPILFYQEIKPDSEVSQLNLMQLLEAMLQNSRDDSAIAQLKKMISNLEGVSKDIYINGKTFVAERILEAIQNKNLGGSEIEQIRELLLKYMQGMDPKYFKEDMQGGYNEFQQQQSLTKPRPAGDNEDAKQNYKRRKLTGQLTGKIRKRQ